MDSFGKIAFEAYKNAKQGATYDAKPIPDWENLGNDVRDAWEVAARAAIWRAGNADARTALQQAYQRCKDAKPNDRSEYDRRLGFLCTRMGDVLAA